MARRRRVVFPGGGMDMEHRPEAGQGDGVRRIEVPAEHEPNRLRRAAGGGGHLVPVPKRQQHIGVGRHIDARLAIEKVPIGG